MLHCKECTQTKNKKYNNQNPEVLPFCKTTLSCPLQRNSQNQENQLSLPTGGSTLRCGSVASAFSTWICLVGKNPSDCFYCVSFFFLTCLSCFFNAFLCFFLTVSASPVAMFFRGSARIGVHRQFWRFRASVIRKNVAFW